MERWRVRLIKSFEKCIMIFVGWIKEVEKLLSERDMRIREKRKFARIEVHGGDA